MVNAVPITGVQLSSNVATITAANSFAGGQRVTVAMTPPNSTLDGSYTLTNATAALFTYGLVVPQLAATGIVSTAVSRFPASANITMNGDGAALNVLANLDISMDEKINTLALNKGVTNGNNVITFTPNSATQGNGNVALHCQNLSQGAGAP